MICKLQIKPINKFSDLIYRSTAILGGKKLHIRLNILQYSNFRKYENNTHSRFIQYGLMVRVFQLKHYC